MAEASRTLLRLIDGWGFMVEHPEVERTVEEFKSEEDVLGYFNDETRARFKKGGALQKAS